jgi:hypothetical protein
MPQTRLSAWATAGATTLLLGACGGRLAGTDDDGGFHAAVVVADAGAETSVDLDATTAPTRPDGGDAAPDGRTALPDGTPDVTSGAPNDAREGEGEEDASRGDAGWVDSCGHKRPDVFADEVIAFTPGPTAGFGQSELPCVVLGPPEGAGATAGSLDVLSLGDQGSIVLAFDDVALVDGPGPDLLVFENAIPGFAEPGFVAVSEDGSDWHEWPCEPQNEDGGYLHCAGIHPVLSNSTNGISPTDPSVAGGDAFDLADLGVTRARYVRVRDSGFSHYGGTTGGFDLDAIAAVNATATGQ